MPAEHERWRGPGARLHSCRSATRTLKEVASRLVLSGSKHKSRPQQPVMASWHYLCADWPCDTPEASTPVSGPAFAAWPGTLSAARRPSSATRAAITLQPATATPSQGRQRPARAGAPARARPRLRHGLAHVEQQAAQLVQRARRAAPLRAQVQLAPAGPAAERERQQALPRHDVPARERAHSGRRRAREQRAPQRSHRCQRARRKHHRVRRRHDLARRARVGARRRRGGLKGARTRGRSRRA